MAEVGLWSSQFGLAVEKSLPLTQRPAVGLMALLGGLILTHEIHNGFVVNRYVVYPLGRLFVLNRPSAVQILNGVPRSPFACGGYIMNNA